MSDRLYMAVHVDGEPDGHYDHQQDRWITDFPEPPGWREFAIARGFVNEDGEPDPFFFPKTNVPYKARSTAQKRVDIINYWGGKAEVVECTPDWVPVAVANKRRADARLQVRIDQKRLELLKLELQLDDAKPVSIADAVRAFNPVKPGV